MFPATAWSHNIHRWLEASHRLAQSLEAAGSSARITTWQAPLWPKAGFATNFKQWRKQRGKPLQPLPAPESISPLPTGQLGSVQCWARALLGGRVPG